MAPASLNGPILGLEEKESVDGEDVQKNEEWCKQCLKGGERNAVSYLQISDELAVLVCNDDQCTSLPTLAPGSHLVVERRAADIMPCRRRKRRSSSLQPKLDSANPQRNLTSHLHPQGPLSAPISPLPPRGIIQWRNESNLCWLDVCMLLLVQFNSLRRCHQALGATSPLRKLCDGFDTAQDIAGAIVEATKKNLCVDTKSNNSSSVEQPAGTSDIELQPVNIGVDLATAGDNELLSDHFLDFLNETPIETAQKVDEMFNDSVLTNKLDSLSSKTLSCEQSALSDETSTEKLAAALESLTRLRKELFEMLRPKLGCKENKEESPISALPALLRLDGATEEHFNLRYRKEFYCFSCGFTNVTIHRNTILSLASTSHDFSMQKPTMHHPCPQCKAMGQTSRVIYHSLPACPLVHFTNGLSSTKDLPWLQPEFRHRGQQYNLSCVIQYKQNPNHFIIWIRDPSREQWMKCDGLSSPVCLWQSQEPSIPPSEIHIVGWERQNGDCYSCQELQQQMIHIHEALQDREDEPVGGTAIDAVTASSECDVAPVRKRSCPVVVGRSASPQTISSSTPLSQAQAARNKPDLSCLSPQPTESLPASSILSIGTPPQSPEFQMPKTSTSSESKDSIPSDTCGDMQASGMVQDDGLKPQELADRETSNRGRWERAVASAKSEILGHESNRQSVASYLRNKLKNPQKPPGVLTGLLGNFPHAITGQQPDNLEETSTCDAVYNPGSKNFSVLQTLRSLGVNSSLKTNNVSGTAQGLDKAKKPYFTKKPSRKSEAITPSAPKKIKKVRLPRPKINSFSAFKEKSMNSFSGYLMAKDQSTADIHTKHRGTCSNINASQIQDEDFQSSVLLTPSSSVSSPSACSDASLQNESLPAGVNEEIESLSNTMNALCKALDVVDSGVPQTVVSHSHSPSVDDDSFLQDLLR